MAAAGSSWECVIKGGKHNVRSAPRPDAPVVAAAALSPGQRVLASGPLQGDWLPIGENRWTLARSSGSRFTRGRVYLECREAAVEDIRAVPTVGDAGDAGAALSQQRSRELEVLSVAIVSSWGDDAESPRSRRRRLESKKSPHVAALQSLCGFCRCYKLVDGRYHPATCIIPGLCVLTVLAVVGAWWASLGGVEHRDANATFS